MGAKGCPGVAALVLAEISVGAKGCPFFTHTRDTSALALIRSETMPYTGTPVTVVFNFLFSDCE